MANTSYSFKLKSHPGKLLKDHISGVLENGRILSRKLPLDKPHRVLLDTVLLVHDAGKASTFFQKYIHAIALHQDGELDENKLLLIKHELGHKKNHALISAVWAFILVLEETGEEPLALFAYLSVRKHHGHLDNLSEMLSLRKEQTDELLQISSEMDYEEFRQILQLHDYTFATFDHETFETHIKKFFSRAKFRRIWPKRIAEQLNLDSFLFTTLTYSVLLAADKGECIFDGVVYKKRQERLPSHLVDAYKSQVFGNVKPAKGSMNELREGVYDSVAASILKYHKLKKFFSINVPTGIGKTFTVINASLKLLEADKSIDKIIYCLPFTSVIDQNARVIGEVIEKNGLEADSEKVLVNHHLSEINYVPDKERESDDEIDENKSEHLINQFESNINVTTFYQFLYGIFSFRNSELRKFHSFSNSIIILDEVQSIPSKYWLLIKETLQLISEKLNITFIFVTATLPLILDEDKGEIQELVENKQHIFNSLDRIDLDTSLLSSELDIEDFVAHFIATESSETDKNYLIILNTIACSKQVYNMLKEAGIDAELLYLSTNIPPVERLRRIQKIKEHASARPLIVVSTQLVEAGVDIDMDIVYRDIAPLDSIFQSAGRCNRNAAKGRGEVRLMSLSNKRGRLYGNFIYGSNDLFITRKLLSEKSSYAEADFFSLGKAYFSRIKNIDDSRHILDAMGKLNYRTAFDKASSEQAFELIEDRPSYPAYILFEEEARLCMEEYHLIAEQAYDDPYQKKRDIRRILRKLSQYAVSVPEKYAYKQDDSSFYIISEDNKDFIYDTETGIEFEGDEGHSFAI
jgi:CRISPR-associated endonuclease/helicase Cas3